MNILCTKTCVQNTSLLKVRACLELVEFGPVISRAEGKLPDPKVSTTFKKLFLKKTKVLALFQNCMLDVMVMSFIVQLEILMAWEISRIEKAADLLRHASLIAHQKVSLMRAFNLGRLILFFVCLKFLLKFFKVKLF